MFCDQCLKDITARLREEHRIILTLLAVDDLHKTEIINRSGLTYAITHEVLNQLEFAGLIKVSDCGKSKVCKITDNGRRMIEMISK